MHGGQVRLPLLGPLVTRSRLPRRLATGLHSYRGVPLFVSRGIGYSGLHLRLHCPAEVALLTLRSPAAGVRAASQGGLNRRAAAPSGSVVGASGSAPGSMCNLWLATVKWPRPLEWARCSEWAGRASMLSGLHEESRALDDCLLQ
jgi:hypothetical protein